MEGSGWSRREFLGASVVGSGMLVGSGALGGALRLEGVSRASKKGEVVTTCNMCNLGCSVLATYEGDSVVNLRGNPASPVNEGKLCAKGNAGIFKAVHPDRLGYPLLRVGERGEGKWKRVTWKEALGRIASGLLAIKKDAGPQSVAFWQNVNMERTDIFERFMYALGSPNFIRHQSACDSSVLVGNAMAVGPVAAVPDLEHADCIVLVGCNPLGVRGSVAATREIMEAKGRGAKLIAIDPRLSQTAAHASKGLWLPVKPGTDGILLAGFANYLIEHDRIDRAFIDVHTFGFDKLKRHLAQFTVAQVCQATEISKAQFLRAVEAMVTKRTVIEANRGVAAHQDGLYTAHMAMCLNALLGSIGQKGGISLLPWPPLKFSPVRPLVAQPTTERIDKANVGKLPLPFLKRAAHPLSFLGISQDVPRNILARDPYPLHALIFNAINPVYSLPNGEQLKEALKTLKLVVSIDAFMSETAQYADIVLPAATYLESRELTYPLASGISLRQPVIRPRMESKSSQDAIILLAKAMGMGNLFPFRDYRGFLRKQLEGTPLSLETLEKRGFVMWKTRPESMLGKLGTPSGRVELASSVLAASGFSPVPLFAKWKAPKEDEAFPYALITYKLPFHTQSATAANPYLNAIAHQNALQINTRTAASLGLKTGDVAIVESVRGSLRVPVQTTEGIHPQTVALSHHFGHTAYSRICANQGVNANSIICDGSDPVGMNIAFNDTRVRIRPV